MEIAERWFVFVGGVYVDQIGLQADLLEDHGGIFRGRRIWNDHILAIPFQNVGHKCVIELGVAPFAVQ